MPRTRLHPILSPLRRVATLGLVALAGCLAGAPARAQGIVEQGPRLPIARPGVRPPPAIPLAPVKLPNLRPLSINVYYLPAYVKIAVRVRNTGLGASGACKMTVRLGVNGKWTSYTVPVPPIAAGAAIPVHVVTLPPGKKLIQGTAIVDVTHVVVETNESDNLTSAVLVAIP